MKAGAPVIEVELKAHLRDRAATLAAVRAFARPAGAVEKRDMYWHAPGWREGRGTKGFRVRCEDGSAVVNFKVKREEDGVEINREVEFAVTDGSAFDEFALRLGCEPHYKKRKSGFAFKAGGDELGPREATIEIFEVEGLGDFIEIEILLDDEDPAQVAEARTEIRAMLVRAGLGEKDVEPRFYSELLMDAGLVTST